MVLALLLSLVLADPSVSGIVKDTDGGAVPGASVVVHSDAGDQQTVTGPDGRFAFDKAPAGSATLIVRAGGFAVKEMPLSSPRDVEVVLAPATVLENVTVTPTRTEQKLGDVAASVSVLDSQEIRQSPAVVADDVLRQVPTFSLFRRTSSLSSHPTSQGVSLRGIGPSGVSRTLVMTDGIPVNDPFGGWVYWTRVPLESVDRIEVVEGSSSSLYGNYAEGGVINIMTAHPSRRTIEVKPQYGNRNSPKFDYFASDVWGKLGIAVEGSIFDTDGFPIVAQAEQAVKTDTLTPIDIAATVKFTNTNVKLDYSPTDRIRASFRGGYFSETRGNGKIDEVNDTKWTTGSGSVRVRLPDESDLQASIFVDHEKFHSTFLAVGGITPATPRTFVRLTLDQHVPTDSVGASVQWNKSIGSMNVVSAGTDWRWVKGDSNEDAYNQSGGLISPVTANVLALQRVSGGRQRSLGAFVQDMITPFPKLTVTAAARVDHWRSYDAHNLETAVIAGTATNNLPDLAEQSKSVVTPRIAAIYHVTDRVNVWGDMSSGFRAPTLNELYRQFRVGTTLTLANFDLAPERLTGGEGGVSVAVTRNLTIRATGFDNRMRNPVFNITTLIVGANTTQQRQNVPKTEIKGFQTEAELHFWDFQIRGAYQLDNAKVTEAPPPPAANIPSIQDKDIQQVPHNRGSFQVAYSNPKVAMIAFDWLAIGAQFDDDLNIKTITDAALAEAGYSAGTPGLPSYTISNFMASRRVTKNIDVFFGVQNLFDKEYFVATGPSTIGSPRLYNGGVRVRWSGR